MILLACRSRVNRIWLRFPESSFIEPDPMADIAADMPFSKLFHEHLNDIERRALKVGSNLTAVCKELGISRSTPDRWRRGLPRTIEIIEEMEQCVSGKEKRAASTHRQS